MKIALLHLEEVTLSGEQRLPAGIALGDIAGVGDVGHREAQHLRFRIAEQLTEGVIHGHEAVWGSAFRRRQTSMPLMSGSCTSRTIRSGAAAARARASAPLAASVTRNP